MCVCVCVYLPLAVLVFMKSDLSRLVFWRPFWKVDWRKMTAIVQARDAKALRLGSGSGDKE